MKAPKMTPARPALPSRHLPLLAALLLGAVGGAGAQNISTSLPLTSVGDKLLWSVGDQSLTLTVKAAGQVKLELYSPQLDPADYRADTYYGDETYDRAGVSTSFTLTDAAGAVVATRSYAPGAQRWDTLLDRALPAGTYTLRASTAGNGKNTFAVRLSGAPASITAGRLAVNVHSAAFVPVLNVSVDGPGYELQLYDGDGAGELEARLRAADGSLTPLAVSGQRGTVSLKLPGQPGQYTVELRQPATARQYSNTVGFSLTRVQGQTQANAPITLSSTEALGTLRVEAELLLPSGSVPTSLPARVGAVTVGTVTVTGEPYAAQRPAGEYPVSVPVVPGAQVLAPDRVTVRTGETAVVRVQVKPAVTLTLDADKRQVCVGDVVRFTARAATAYAGELPLSLSLHSDALGMSSEPLTGTLSADHPGELSVEARPTQAGDFSVLARLGPWGDTQALNVTVLPDATALQLRRAPLTAARSGNTLTVALSVMNTGTAPAPYTLTDAPGEGLEALDAATFSGTLAPGETRALSYRARVTAAQGPVNLQARLVSPQCGAAQTVGGTLEVLAPAAAPAVTRRSTVSLPFEAPAPARSVIVAQALPAGASYVPGSSRLDGAALPDPLQGPGGTLYWTLPAPVAQPGEREVGGAISYDLSHTAVLGALGTPALVARYDRERQETLMGRFDAADYAAAQPLSAAPTRSQNAGAIKLPLAGTVFRDRDRVRVTVVGAPGAVPPLRVNGEAVSEKLIGSRTTDPAQGTETLEYVGVPIRVGRNVLSLGSEQEEVYLAGPAARVTVTPIQAVADGSTPLRFKVVAQDAAGQGSAERFLDVGTTLEPLTPDASAADAGYQIVLQDGVGELVLRPQTAPTALAVSVQVGGRVQVSRFQIVPDDTRVGVGTVSATVGLGAAPSISAVARAYYEGPLLGGKLYVAADSDGLPTTQNPYLRYPLHGDSSTETVPLQGLDPVAFSYDHPGFHVQYRQDALPITVFPLGTNLTALSGASKSNPSVSGFLAFIPGDLKTETLIPDGTRLLRLAQGGVVQGSESVQLIVSRNGQELSRSPLGRDVDYTLDPLSGVITLTRGLERLDANLNDLSVLISYRLSNPNQGRTLGYGAETRYQGQSYTAAAAVVNVGGATTAGVRAALDLGSLGTGTVQASALAAYSGGVQLSADVLARRGDSSAALQLRSQTAGYAGVNPFSVGTTLRAGLGTRVGRVGLSADAEYHALPAGQGAGPQTATGGQAVLNTNGGSVSAQAAYTLQPFTVGAGVRAAFGDVYGLGVVGKVGYHQAPLDVDLTHTQPLSGNLLPVSEFSARAAIGKATLGLRDTLTWGGDNVAALTLGTTLGNTTYAVSYDLPTASGAGNRARFGVDTSLPLSASTALGLRGSVLHDLNTGQNEASAGADVRFQSRALSATLGGDVSFRAGVLNTVLRGGVSGALNRNLTLTADGTLALSAITPGARAAAGYAYRHGPWNSLGYLRYTQGSLSASGGELSAGASAEFHVPRYALRAGIDTRTLLSDPGSFTYQPSVGGTYYFSDVLGAGAWGRALLQPGSGTAELGYGLEGSVRALPGTWLSVGYNFAGFDGLSGQSGAYTRKGLYLRLDLTLDDSELGGEK